MPLFSLPCELDEYLYSQIDNPDLYRLSWTCQEAYQRVTSFLNRAFRFHEYLARYFTGQDLFTLLQMQERTNFFFSGDAVLYYLMRTEHVANTLDILISAKHTDEISKWISSSGYRTLATDPTLSTQLSKVRPTDMTETEFWAPLVITHYQVGYIVTVTLELPHTEFRLVFSITTEAVIQLVLRKPSTAQMNIATSTHIYSLYPAATFQHALSLVRSRRDHYEHNISHLLRRDLKLSFTKHWNNFKIFPSGQRHVGDKYTWTLKISLTDEYTRSRSGSFLSTNNWLAHCTPSREFEIHGIAFRSKSLDQSYIFSTDILCPLVEKIMRDGRKASRTENRKRKLDNDLYEVIEEKYREGRKYLLLDTFLI